LSTRYFFHLVGGDRTKEDKAGTVLAGPEAARLWAASVAAALIGEPLYRSFMVYVVDDDGNEVVRCPVANAKNVQ
jgi:hypothetical protein